jgi:TetR/AcrR family transcriptional regulator, cholesterol catabolism regulator
MATPTTRSTKRRGERRPLPESKSARTRRRILDACAAALRRDGYAAVTLKDVAALAGLQAGSLYYHFRSKEEIVEEVLGLGVDGVARATRDAVDALGPGAGALARVRAAITGHLRYVLAESDYAVANIRILSQVPHDIRERHLVRQRRYGAYWRALFEDAANAGALRSDLDLSVVRMLALGALNWSVEWYDARGAAGPAKIADCFATMMLEGLARSPQNRRGRGRHAGIANDSTQR